MLIELSSSDFGPINALLAGQSLVAQLSTGTGIGETNMQAALDSFNGSSTNTIVNTANGGSFLTKTAHDASMLANDEYWVDDDNAPTYAAGPLLTTAYAAVVSAGLTMKQINTFYWSQCAAEAPYVANATLSQAEYKAALTWMYDDVRSKAAGNLKIVQQDIENRTNASDGYQPIKEVYGELEAENADVYGTAANYDGTKADTIHYTDDAAGYGLVGTRGGNAIAQAHGLTGGKLGPTFSSATISGNTITAIVTHNGGTTLNSYSGTPVDASATLDDDNFFTIQDADGNIYDPTQVQVTGTNEITITLPIEPVGDVTVYPGFGSMGLVNISETLITDDNDLPLRGFAIAKSVNFSNLTTPLMLFSAERDPAATTTPLYYDTGAGAGADVWTNLGSGGNAYRDGSAAAPTWVADLSGTISGAPAVPAIYADGSDAIKLLVQHALTTTSPFTLFVKFFPDDDVTDTVGGVRNTIASFAGAATDSTHGAIAQVKGDAIDMDYYIGGVGAGFGDFASGGTFVIQWVDATNGNQMNTGDTGWTAVNHSAGTSQIDDTNSNGTGTPLFAIANDVDKPTGASGSTMTGGIMFVLMAASALSAAQSAHIVRELDRLVTGGADYTLGI